MLYKASRGLIRNLLLILLFVTFFVRMRGCHVVQVVCEVMSVHWDRLDVKVAVRYPKSYGPWEGHNAKVRRQELG